MGLKILSARDFSTKLKATVHSTGKLGFTEATAKELNITKESGVKFAQDDRDENVLYLIHCEKCDADSFKVMSAGNYFSVNAKGLFDNLGYDYRSNSVIFDMTKEIIDGVEVYKLIKREKPRK